MNSKQIFMIVTIIVALSVVMIATPVMAQNMTGGNMTGGNMTGKISGGFDFHGQQMAKCIPPEVKVDPFTCGIPSGSGGGPPGGLDQYTTSQEAAKCTPPEVEVSEGKCGVRQGGGSADSATATAVDVEGTGCPVSAEGTPDGFCLQDKPQDEGQGEDDEEEQEGGN